MVYFALTDQITDLPLFLAETQLSWTSSTSPLPSLWLRNGPTLAMVRTSESMLAPPAPVSWLLLPWHLSACVSAGRVVLNTLWMTRGTPPSEQRCRTSRMTGSRASGSTVATARLAASHAISTCGFHSSRFLSLFAFVYRHERFCEPYSPSVCALSRLSQKPL